MATWNNDLHKELYQIAFNALKSGDIVANIEENLKKKTDDLVLITVALKEARKDYHAILQKEGLRCILIGVIFVASGFLITLFNFGSNSSFDYALFGFTSVGICFIFYGLFRMIG